MVLGRRGHATLRDVVWSSIDARASPAPARRPAPEVAPTASSASAVGSVGSASQSASWGSASPRIAQSSSVADSRVVVPEATAYGRGQHVVGPAQGGAGGEPPGQHVVAERRQARPAADEAVEVGRGEAAVGGEVEAVEPGRHGVRSSGRPLRMTSHAGGARVDEAGDPDRPVTDHQRAVAAPRRPGRGRRGRAASTRARTARGSPSPTRGRGTSRRGRRTGRCCSRGRPGEDRRTLHGADRAPAAAPRRGSVRTSLPRR